MNKKRGFGHVEAILTFVIFVGFLIFAFVFFSPFESGRTLKSTLDYAWREVADVTEKQLEVYSVAITDSLASQLVAIAISGTPAGWNAAVENSSGNPISSYTDLSGNVNFDRGINNFFVRIKFAEDFAAGNTISGTQLSQNQYNISSSEVAKVRFENLFNKLKTDYNADYIALNKQFNLPSRVNFGFSVRFNDGYEIRASREIPENAEVLSQSDRVEIVRMPSGKREYAEVNVFVW